MYPMMHVHKLFLYLKVSSCNIHNLPRFKNLVCLVRSPLGGVDAVRVGAVGTSVNRARPALSMRSLGEADTGKVRFGLQV